MNYSKSSLILNESPHIELSEHDRRRNIFITGLPSTGVSTYTTGLIFQDIDNRLGTIILDPYGYLSTKILSQMSQVQLEKTAYFDLGNIDYPIGLNLFQAKKDDDKREIANTVIDLIYALYDPTRTGIIGPRFDHAVRNAVLTVLHDEQSGFIELVRCLTDKAYVDKLLPKISDLTIKNYWTKQIANTSDFHKSEVLDYIVSKFGRFVTDPKIRNIVNQTESGLDFDNLLNDKKLIIFDFGKFINDFEALKILSEVILTKLSLSLKRVNRENDVSLYVDEVDLFSSSKLAELLRYSNNYRINLSFITQRAAELETNLRNELLRSGTVIAFRLSSNDAKVLAPEFHKNISIDHLCMLNKYHMVIKTLKNGNPVIYEEINNEKGDYKELSKSMKELEELKLEKTKVYGRPHLAVEAEIAKRMA